MYTHKTLRKGLDRANDVGPMIVAGVVSDVG